MIYPPKKVDNEFILVVHYGWVSYLHRAATTDYLCCGQALEDSSGAGRIGLTHISAGTIPLFSAAKVRIIFSTRKK